MSEYFPKPASLGANVKVELDFSNYAIKADYKKTPTKANKHKKNAAGVDTSKK